jgi:hypothetical protein
VIKLKEMPDSEKYSIVIDDLEFEKSFTLPFVQKNLGAKAAAELNKLIRDGFKPIPADAPFKQKYEMAYSNWMSFSVIIFAFIRKHLGEDGMERFERANVEALKQKNASPALKMLGLIRLFSAGTAFSMTARKMAYQLQWLTPYSISELSSSRLALDMPRCKILDYPNNDDVCLIGCQKIYPIWVAEQFRVNMQFNRQGTRCSMILSPLT